MAMKTLELLEDGGGGVMENSMLETNMLSKWPGAPRYFRDGFRFTTSNLGGAWNGPHYKTYCANFFLHY